jgi:hypothetical protein
MKENIINELQKSRPSKKKIVIDLFKNQKLPYPKMIETVEDIFRLQPDSYMEHLYKVIRKKVRKVYGRETLKEMEKKIIENHCLQEGEQILLEFDGAVQLFENPTLKSRGANAVGTVFVTNKRIFVQGSIVAVNGSFASGFPARRKIITTSRQNRCYGYIFPTISVSQLARNQMTKGVNFNISEPGFSHQYQKVRVLIRKTINRDDTINQLYDVLSKNA